VKSRAFGAALVLLLGASFGRHMLEQSMASHMLVQIPLLLCAGVLFSIAMGTRQPTPTHETHGYNAYGIAGLVFASGMVASWMVPRALDAAVEQLAWDSGKIFSLVAAGALAHRSWQRATTMVRAFVVGNSLWMNATIGLLLIDAPNRLCTSYTTNDQAIAGYGLVGIAVCIGVIASVFVGGASAHDEQLSARLVVLRLQQHQPGRGRPGKSITGEVEL